MAGEDTAEALAIGDVPVLATPRLPELADRVGVAGRLSFGDGGYY